MNQEEINAKARVLVTDCLKGKLATLKEDFYTDDECSCGVLIKKDSNVYIRGNESNGTCYAVQSDFGFSIDIKYLNFEENEVKQAIENL